MSILADVTTKKFTNTRKVELADGATGSVEATDFILTEPTFNGTIASLDFHTNKEPKVTVGVFDDNDKLFDSFEFTVPSDGIAYINTKVNGKLGFKGNLVVGKSNSSDKVAPYVTLNVADEDVFFYQPTKLIYDGDGCYMRGSTLNDTCYHGWCTHDGKTKIPQNVGDYFYTTYQQTQGSYNQFVTAYEIILHAGDKVTIKGNCQGFGVYICDLDYTIREIWTKADFNAIASNYDIGWQYTAPKFTRIYMNKTYRHGTNPAGTGISIERVNRFDQTNKGVSTDWLGLLNRILFIGDDAMGGYIGHEGWSGVAKNFSVPGHVKNWTPHTEVYDEGAIGKTVATYDWNSILTKYKASEKYFEVPYTVIEFEHETMEGNITEDVTKFNGDYTKFNKNTSLGNYAYHIEELRKKILDTRSVICLVIPATANDFQKKQYFLLAMALKCVIIDLTLPLPNGEIIWPDATDKKSYSLMGHMRRAIHFKNQLSEIVKTSFSAVYEYVKHQFGG